MEKTSIIISNCRLLDLNSQQEITVINEIIIGRVSGTKTFPEDSKMSRRHFRLVPAEDLILIQDLGSTNQTRVNGKSLKPNILYKLRSRDIINAGNQKFQIFIDGKICQDESQREKIKDPMVTAIIDTFSAARTPESKRKQIELSMQQIEAPEIDDQPSFQPLEAQKQAKINSAEISEPLADIARENMEDAKENNKLISLSENAKQVWYLQFEGSEFGPIKFHELEGIVKSQQFQGGELYVWTDGLDSWVNIDSKHKVFSKGTAE